MSASLYSVLNSLSLFQQVAKAMSDEIRRLGYLVGDFDYPFHPHHGFLRTYKAVSSVKISFTEVS